MHETFDRAPPVKTSSDRSFGLVFAAVFAIVGLIPLVRAQPARAWALGIAVAFVVVALVRPALLAPANRLWTRLGALLHRIVNPVVTGLLFYLAVTPTGLIIRAMGRDPLRLRRDPAAESYWIRRDPPGPPPESMPQQF